MAHLRSVVNAQQFDKAMIEEVFATARTMEHDHPRDALQGKLMATLFGAGYRGLVERLLDRV